MSEHDDDGILRRSLLQCRSVSSFLLPCAGVSQPQRIEADEAESSGSRLRWASGAEGDRQATVVDSYITAAACAIRGI